MKKKKDIDLPSKDILKETDTETLPLLSVEQHQKDENKEGFLAHTDGMESQDIDNKKKASKPSKKAHYHGHRDRLRKRVLADTQSVESYELLELLLGYVQTRVDTKPLAKDLLARFGSLWGVLNAHPTELDAFSSMGPSSKTFFILLRELVGRYFVEPIKSKKSVSLDDVAMLARCMLDGLPHEEVWAALLDNNNRLLGFEKLSAGFIDSVSCSPRIVAEMAIAKKAKGIILVHNHPGGVEKVSWADAEMTTQMKTVLQYMGIRLVDHLILADGKVISMANNHFLS